MGIIINTDNLNMEIGIKCISVEDMETSIWAAMAMKIMEDMEMRA
jgi:hypothetical protein